MADTTQNAGTAQKRQVADRIRRKEAEARRRAIAERDEIEGLQVEPTASYYDTDARKPGTDNWTRFGFDLHPHVTFVSAALVILFILLTLMFREQAAGLFSSILSGITGTFGWFLILTVNVFIIAALVFAFSRFGKLRIGGPDALPEFSTLAWYAMLLSAGMGIGLMFWSVGEPMFHFNSPAPLFGVEAGTPEAAQAAMGTTYFHWGLHPWAVYAIVGLGLAFFAFNRGLPLTIRSIFYPLLGERIYGFWGNLIDIISVIATLFGLATSLGFGVQQVNAGLQFLFGVPFNAGMQVLLIAIITGFATLSVMAGLDGGVKRLSQWNMVLAAVFAAFLLLVGPTIFILSGFVENFGFYLANLPRLSLWTETFRESNWQGSWTVFYWAWWISWSPFVGMFIARVSKGRTVREFILGVMIVPTLLSFLWMSVFGGSALFLELRGMADIIGAVNEDVATAMFAMLAEFPLSFVTGLIGIILVTVFFVTSSDSGSLVVDHLTSGGKLDSPVPQRVFWAITEGAIAAVLLLGGGLTALQTVAVATGLPFAVVLLFIIYALYVGFNEELYVEDAVRRELEEHELEELEQARAAMRAAATD